MKVKISRLQLFFVIPNILFGKAIGITAGVMARKIGSDTWTSMLIGFIIGSMFMGLVVFLCSKFPQKSIIQYSEDIIGKWGGKTLGFALTVFFIFAYGTSANVMTLHLSEYLLTSTPFIVICIAYTLVCLYGAFLGIEVTMRFCLVGFFGLLLVNLTMILGTIKDFQFINLKPILNHGFQKNLLDSVYVFSDLAMGILAVSMLYPMLNNKSKVGTLTFWAMLLSALVIVIWPFFETGVIGSDMMQKYVVCCMQQVRSAQLTKYLPRYELLMVSFFALSVYVQSVVMFYLAKSSFKQITGIKNDIYILIPLSVILILVTYYQAKDDNKFVIMLTNPWPQICLALCAGLPLLLYFIALFRGKLNNTNGNTPKK